MIYIESKDDCEVIRSIEKMECNLALLTKAYIEFVNMGPLMNTLKKTFKHSSQKVFEKCKNCIRLHPDSNSGIIL